jgi:virginiamycin B lyase
VITKFLLTSKGYKVGLISNRTRYGILAGAAIVLIVSLLGSTLYPLSTTERNSVQAPEVFSVTPSQETIVPVQMVLRTESSSLTPVVTTINGVEDLANIPIGVREAFGIGPTQNSVTLTEWSLPSAPNLATYQSSTGDIWFTEQAANKVARFKPSTNELTEWTLPTAGSGPCLVTFESTGKVYFTERSVSKVARLDPLTNGLVEWTLPGALPGFASEATDYCRIGIDPSNNIYVLNPLHVQFGHQWVLRLNPSTNQATMWNIGGGNGNLRELHIDTSTGNTAAYFTENNNNAISRLFITGPNTDQVTRWAIPQPSSGPGAVKFDASTGNFFFGEGSGNRIARLNPSTNQITQWIVPTAGSNPYWIAVDSVGTVFFSEGSANKVGRLVPSTSLITEWTLLGAGNNPAAAFVDSSANFWFTEFNTSKIARIV